MVRITKQEMELIRQKVPSAHIAIVNRQTSHKGYYAEETAAIAAALMEIRSAGVLEGYGSDGCEAQEKHKRQHRRKKKHRHPNSLADLPSES